MHVRDGVGDAVGTVLRGVRSTGELRECGVAARESAQVMQLCE